MAVSLPRALRRWVRPAWSDALAAALPGWVVARVAVGVAFVAAVVAVDELRPGERTEQLHQGLLAWDGAWYGDIAEDGYAALPAEALRFFPLVPLLARALSVLFAGNTTVALVVVGNVAALLAAAVVHRLVLHETDDLRLAARATWAVALLPPAFVLVLGYAESTLMALSAAAFLCLRRKQWGWAAVLGLLAGLCRPVGILLVVPALVEAARGVRSASWGERAARGAAVAAPAVGVATFLAWVGWKFDDAWLPLRVQQREDLRGSFVNPVARVVDAVQGLFGDERLGEGLHVPFIVVFVVLLVVVIRRWPAAYGAYTGAMLVVALSAESLGSFERYSISAFPLALAVATLTTAPRLERAAWSLCGAGLLAFASLAWLGTYVP